MRSVRSLIIRDRLTPSGGVDLGAERVRGVGLGDVGCAVWPWAVCGAPLGLGGVRVRRLALGGLRWASWSSSGAATAAPLIVSTSVFTVVA